MEEVKNNQTQEQENKGATIDTTLEERLKDISTPIMVVGIVAGIANILILPEFSFGAVVSAATIAIIAVAIKFIIDVLAEISITLKKLNDKK